ncbi:hypothetical protein ArV1_035 [Arthrobacter phage vB_ArtM-ArV1]|uniref:Uncharacterized protein n=1 Tax=Arthrobacter phage vB_ArtM-ArV1 TaxID=1566993 RepID=A0A0A7HAW4_9CAUD|nr:hypothetical protein ArV1_035 [Arthrobacter phage vB_ArtM-ArV1]AIZ01723.1 hypothetical protein ArV1_035 [Arthrobacter phage vB_ArtM-ArV1]
MPRRLGTSTRQPPGRRGRKRTPTSPHGARPRVWESCWNELVKLQPTPYSFWETPGAILGVGVEAAKSPRVGPPSAGAFSVIATTTGVSLSVPPQDIGLVIATDNYRERPIGHVEATQCPGSFRSLVCRHAAGAPGTASAAPDAAGRTPRPAHGTGLCPGHGRP